MFNGVPRCGKPFLKQRVPNNGCASRRRGDGSSSAPTVLKLNGLFYYPIVCPCLPRRPDRIKRGIMGCLNRIVEAARQHCLVRRRRFPRPRTGRRQQENFHGGRRRFLKPDHVQSKRRHGDLQSFKTAHCTSWIFPKPRQNRNAVASGHHGDDVFPAIDQVNSARGEVEFCKSLGQTVGIRRHFPRVWREGRFLCQCGEFNFGNRLFPDGMSNGKRVPR